MPKTRFDRFAKPVPPPNMLRDLFNRYQKARGMTSEDLGERLKISATAVRMRKYRGTWSAEDIRAWCAALGITDPEEVGKAVLNRV